MIALFIESTLSIWNFKKGLKWMAYKLVRTYALVHWLDWTHLISWIFQRCKHVWNLSSRISQQMYRPIQLPLSGVKSEMISKHLWTSGQERTVSSKALRCFAGPPLFSSELYVVLPCFGNALFPPCMDLRTKHYTPSNTLSSMKGSWLLVLHFTSDTFLPLCIMPAYCSCSQKYSSLILQCFLFLFFFFPHC